MHATLICTFGLCCVSITLVKSDPDPQLLLSVRVDGGVADPVPGPGSAWLLIVLVLLFQF